MNRAKFAQNFSRRLTSLLSENGISSNRTKTGVNINELSKIAGCSYQMARKYSLGQALPEMHIINKIAAQLKTSPSWLLFGENESSPSRHKFGAIIEIEPGLLKYILSKSSKLFSLTCSPEDVSNFIVDTVYDATHLNSDTKTIHKIIDMMISSATLLSGKKEATSP